MDIQEVVVLHTEEEVEVFKLEEKEEKYRLYIPMNVKTRLEFFKGFGIKELITTVIVLVALLPISFIVFKLKNSYLLPVVIEFIGVAGTVIMNTKDDNNLCVVNQIKYMIEFAKTQKEYKYNYYNKLKEG